MTDSVVVEINFSRMRDENEGLRGTLRGTRVVKSKDGGLDVIPVEKPIRFFYNWESGLIKQGGFGERKYYHVKDFVGGKIVVEKRKDLTYGLCKIEEVHFAPDTSKRAKENIEDSVRRYNELIEKELASMKSRARESF